MAESARDRFVVVKVEKTSARRTAKEIREEVDTQVAADLEGQPSP